jgi:hypothetical protein
MRQEAALLATLFLNFAFWHVFGNALWFPFPLPVSAVLIALLSALVCLLFLAGPALAVYRSGNGLFPAIEGSLGAVPTHAIRLCSFWFLALWLSDLVRRPASWELSTILHRDTDLWDTLIASALLLAFLAYTALQSHQTCVTLAKFTNRLAIAVLLAAAIRLHEAWPTTLPILLTTGPDTPSRFPFQRFTHLAFDLAPLALLAAAYAQRLTSQKEVLRTAALGFATPLCAVLLLLSAINFTTFHSSFYKPSLEPTIAMALWGGAAPSAFPGGYMITTITTFGAIRFCIGAIPTAIPDPRFHLPSVCAVLTGVALLVVFTPDPLSYSAIPTTVLAIVTAILTADALHNRPTPPKQIDSVATLALLTALAVAYAIANTEALPNQSWWHPWLFPAYLTAFTITLAGRKLQRS